MATNPRPAAGIAACLVLALVGCSAPADVAAGSPPTTPTPSVSADAVPTPPETETPPPTATTQAPATERSPSATPSEATPRPDRDRKPRNATMSIPAIGVEDLRVVTYKGSPDDAPGTRIQNRGVAASPHGPGGGVGPGQVGNYIVTAHRTSAGAPFGELPAVRNGAHVLVVAGGTVYDYEVTQTRSTSFRSERSLARQSAPVPGHPGKPATRPMITLSTCATPEDHARGNYWSDEFGNPEHRIDKVGVLVDVRPR